MNKRNYQQELEKIIQQQQRVPSLLLHSCCAPCSSYVLEYLSDFFRITLFYYNPNISPLAEKEKRVREQRRLIEEMCFTYPVDFVEGEYHPNEFYRRVCGLESEKEGGRRCRICFAMRLEMAAQKARAGGFDYFTTTLSISPLKDAAVLNEIGEALAKEYEIAYLPADFKKKNGYKRSVELSKKHQLYRQDYCGCIFSKESSSLDFK